MGTPKTSAELKNLAKDQLLGNYLTSAAVFMLSSFIRYLLQSIQFTTLAIGSPVALILAQCLSFLIDVLLGILVLGQANFYLHLSVGQPARVSQLFYGFTNRPSRALIVQLFCELLPLLPALPGLVLLYLYLVNQTMSLFWAGCLAWLAGEIAAIYIQLSLSQSFYLLLDFPSYTPKQALRQSQRLMKGNKKRLLFLELSFLPYYLLCLLSFGAAAICVVPYRNTARANFYLDLMRAGREIE